MKQNKIYKFTNKTINIKQYIKDINNIHNIVIFGNTTNLLGTFERVYSDKENEIGYEYNGILYDNPCPLPEIDNLENSNNNLDIFDKLIDNNVDILIICGNDVTKTYWEDIYEYYVIRNNGIEIKNFRMLNFDENKNSYEYEVNKIIEKNKKFDVILANPPYGDIGKKMLYNFFNISNEIVSIQPSNWLITKSQNKKITNNVDNCDFVEIETVDGNEYFDAAIAGRITINHFIQQNNSTHHNRRYILFDGKKYNKCNEITLTSNDSLLNSFIEKTNIDKLTNKLSDYIKVTNNSKAYTYAPHVKFPSNKYICRIKAFSGQSNVRSKLIGEFYNLFSNKEKYTDVCGIADKLNSKISRNGNQYVQYFIEFDNENELQNFWKYTHTLFVSVCIYCFKKNLHLDDDTLTHIPWVDFNNKIFSKTIEDIDIYLFDKYNISKDIVNHILEIVPNYYNLDLNKYKNIKVEN